MFVLLLQRYMNAEMFVLMLQRYMNATAPEILSAR